MDLTTAQAAAYLNARGGFPFVVSRQLVHQWCKRGKFAGARKVGGRGRGTWLIPEVELLTFQQPKEGRPRGRRTRRG